METQIVKVIEEQMNNFFESLENKNKTKYSAKKLMEEYKKYFYNNSNEKSEKPIKKERKKTEVSQDNLCSAYKKDGTLCNGTKNKNLDFVNLCTLHNNSYKKNKGLVYGYDPERITDKDSKQMIELNKTINTDTDNEDNIKVKQSVNSKNKLKKQEKLIKNSDDKKYFDEDYLENDSEDDLF